MVNELTAKELTQMLETKLSLLEEPVLLQNPTDETAYPCRAIQIPLETIIKTEKGTPILKTFKVSIEHYGSTKYEVMEIASETDKKLQELNFIRTETIKEVVDELTGKFKFITIYEARYNGLTNTLNFIK